MPASLEARRHVSALYQVHALALVKLAVLMTGDQPTAEDVVQDAFLGLYRRWQALHDADKAIGYLRSSVLNGCRSVHRTRRRRQGITIDPPGPVGSAEAEAMLGEAHREVLAALRRLPQRHRQARSSRRAARPSRHRSPGTTWCWRTVAAYLSPMTALAARSPTSPRLPGRTSPA
ncbi:MAG TPA: sigma factor [Trebonia sp.]